MKRQLRTYFKVKLNNKLLDEKIFFAASFDYAHDARLNRELWRMLEDKISSRVIRSMPFRLSRLWGDLKSHLIGNLLLQFVARLENLKGE
jgi:hypothetical protein